MKRYQCLETFNSATFQIVLVMVGVGGVGWREVDKGRGEQWKIICLDLIFGHHFFLFLKVYF